MSVIGNRIKELRKKRGLNQTELADALNLQFGLSIDRVMISKWETGFQTPVMSTVVCLSKFFGVSTDYITGRSDDLVDDDILDLVNEIDNDILENVKGNLHLAKQLQYLRDKGFDVSLSSRSPKVTNEYTTFPVIGEIAAGYNYPAIEDWSGETVDIPNSFFNGRRKDDFFVLRVKGDSMYPTYQDGDCVLVRKQTTLNYSGEVGAILYDDDLATLKRVEYKEGENWLKLIPINPAFPPERIEGEKLDHCRVIGLPVYLVRKINE